MAFIGRYTSPKVIKSNKKKRVKKTKKTGVIIFFFSRGAWMDEHAMASVTTCYANAQRLHLPLAWPTLNIVPVTNGHCCFWIDFLCCYYSIIAILFSLYTFFLAFEGRPVDWCCPIVNSNSHVIIMIIAIANCMILNQLNTW